MRTGSLGTKRQAARERVSSRMRRLRKRRSAAAPPIESAVSESSAEEEIDRELDRDLARLQAPR